MGLLFQHALTPPLTIPRPPPQLEVAAACIPHPEKVDKGGEDAFGVIKEKGFVALADGVGGWGDEGVDPAAYAQALVANCLVARDGGQSDPLKVLVQAHARTKVLGSATAVVLQVERSRARVAVVGDAGILHARKGKTLFVSPPQQHRFNCPYQARGSLPSPQPSQTCQPSYRCPQGIYTLPRLPEIPPCTPPTAATPPIQIIRPPSFFLSPPDHRSLAIRSSCPDRTPRTAPSSSSALSMPGTSSCSRRTACGTTSSRRVRWRRSGAAGGALPAPSLILPQAPPPPQPPLLLCFFVGCAASSRCVN